MTTLCVVCPTLSPSTPPRLPAWPTACDGCRTWLRRELSALPDAVASLPLTPGTGSGPRVTGTPEPRLPLRVAALDLTMPANPGSRVPMTRAALGLDDDQAGDLSAATMLDDWARDWREVLHIGDQLPTPTVSALSGWLLVRLDDACDDHPAIDEFAADLHDLVRAVRAATNAGADRGEKVGACPGILRDQTRCGAALRADPYVDRIACGRCATTWSRHGGGWLALRGMQDQAEAERQGRMAVA